MDRSKTPSVAWLTGVKLRAETAARTRTPTLSTAAPITPKTVAVAESINLAKAPRKTPSVIAAMIAPKTPAVVATKGSSLWPLGVCLALLPAMVTAPITGPVASSAQYPFVVGLFDQTNEINYIPFCSGTIINSEFILTTSGCLLRDKDKGGTYRRKDNITPKDVVVLFGSSFSPTITKNNDKIYPNWKLDPTTSTRKSTEVLTNEWYYDARLSEGFYYPNKDDFKEALHGEKNLDEIQDNEYMEEIINSDGVRANYSRYYLDFAVIMLQIPITWSADSLPAIFPFEDSRLARVYWSQKVENDLSGIDFMEPCYLIGWGGWNGTTETQMRMRNTEVRFVPYSNCEISYCNECSYCDKTWRVNKKLQACYAAVRNGETCLEDEGGPLWCPWAGATTRRHGKPFKTGAVMGILSHSTSCIAKTVPSIYSNSWQAFDLISRVIQYAFPPSLLTFEDILEDPPEERESEDEKTDSYQ